MTKTKRLKQNKIKKKILNRKKIQILRKNKKNLIIKIIKVSLYF